ncbi:class II aldolase/adducin family protein [Janthinobacterium lividum]|nr:class II aldolase/adducin family protein [Janthinobacterium lividum]
MTDVAQAEAQQVQVQELSAAEQAFVEQVRRDAQTAFDGLRETGSLTANGTVGFVERTPGGDKVVVVNDPGPFRRGQPLKAAVLALDGTVIVGDANNGGARYLKLFRERPEVTSISHVHSPSLGAWAQTHRTLPIRYVPVQRFQLIREIPIYIDRRQPEVDFILGEIARNTHATAILEANGGATCVGQAGLAETGRVHSAAGRGRQDPDRGRSHRRFARLRSRRAAAAMEDEQADRYGARAFTASCHRSGVTLSRTGPRCH